MGSPAFTAGLDGAGVPTVVRWRGQFSMPAILDGTSNTLLFGEKHIRPNSLRGRNEDRSVYAGNQNNFRRMAGYSNLGTLAGTIRPLMHPLEQAYAQANSSFGGPHAGVCQFAFCDGSVKPLRIGIDLTTLTYLAAQADGKAVGDN
jgi:prepilin-type processing-associated H-X9-DG protein